MNKRKFIIEVRCKRCKKEFSYDYRKGAFGNCPDCSISTKYALSSKNEQRKIKEDIEQSHNEFWVSQLEWLNAIAPEAIKRIADINLSPFDKKPYIDAMMWRANIRDYLKQA